MTIDIAGNSFLNVGERVVLSDDESLECAAIVIAKDYERMRVEFRTLSPLRTPAPLGPHASNGVGFTDVGIDDSDVPIGETVYAANTVSAH
ncbi:MAG: hypothetical protein H0U59_10105 [Gemmatimonadaceae bacterium]|nr:hypothetical protein [Gemmatimonadaceae bacterium]